MDKYAQLFALGQRIKRRRESLGMTQESLAFAVGYKSRTSINKIELGKTDIVQSTVIDIANALGTTPAYLMGWEVDPDKLPIQQECIESNLVLDQQEQKLVTTYRALNDEGQTKLLDYADDLSGNYKYKKSDFPTVDQKTS